MATGIPYRSGRCLFISFDDKQEWLLPLQGMPESQGHVLDNLAEYLAPIGVSAVFVALMRELQMKPTYALELIAWGASVLVGAFAL